MVDGGIGVQLEEFLHLSLHLVGVNEFIYEFLLHIVLGRGEHNQAVGIGVELFHGEFTACGHILAHVVPCALQESCVLLAVGGAHLRLGVNLRGALERAHLHYLIFHAKLFQGVGQEHRLCSQSVPVEHTLRVDVDGVCHRGQIVVALRVAVAVGHNPLAALFKVGQRAANGAQRGIGGSHTVGLHVDAFDVVVGLGFFQSREDSVQSRGFAVIARQRGKRIVGSLFADFTAQVEHQHRVVAHILFRLARGNHAHQTHHAEDEHQCTHQHQANHRGQHVLEKIFHRFCSIYV